jgi:hypothetical protein
LCGFPPCSLLLHSGCRIIMHPPSQDYSNYHFFEEDPSRTCIDSIPGRSGHTLKYYIIIIIIPGRSGHTRTQSTSSQFVLLASPPRRWCSKLESQKARNKSLRENSGLPRQERSSREKHHCFSLGKQPNWRISSSSSDSIIIISLLLPLLPVSY